MIIRFWRDDQGATAIEYCLIAGLVSVLLVVGVTAIGAKLSAHYFLPVTQGLS